MQRPIPLTRSESMVGYLEALRGVGAPVEGDLRRADLPSHFDRCSHGWLPYLKARSFLDDASRRYGIPDLGRRAAFPGIARHVIRREIVAHVLSAPTLHCALRRFARFVKSQSTHLDLWLETAHDMLCVWHVNGVGSDVPGYAIVDSFTTWALVDLVRQYVGPGWSPARVFHRHVPTVGGCGRRVGSDVVSLPAFDRGGFEIPMDFLARGPVREDRADADLEGWPDPPPRTVAATLRSILGMYVLDGRPCVNLGAALVGRSIRGLQRVLQEEGTSWSQVLDLARFDVACRLLEEGEAPLTEIALRLGYSEQSAFSRAFRAWAGVAPSQYRKIRAAAGTDTSPRRRAGRCSATAA